MELRFHDTCRIHARAHPARRTHPHTRTPSSKLGCRFGVQCPCNHREVTDGRCVGVRPGCRCAIDNSKPCPGHLDDWTPQTQPIQMLSPVRCETRWQTHALPDTRTRTQTHAHRDTHTHTHTHTRRHTRTHTRTRAHMQAHTCMRTCRDTHTQTQTQT